MTVPTRRSVNFSDAERVRLDPTQNVRHQQRSAQVKFQITCDRVEAEGNPMLLRSHYYDGRALDIGKNDVISGRRENLAGTDAFVTAPQA